MLELIHHFFFYLGTAPGNLIKRSIETEEDADVIAFQIAKRLEYGLKLVKERSGIDNFVLNKDAIINMDGYVNSLIKRYYRQEISRN